MSILPILESLGNSYLIRAHGETSWQGPLGPYKDLAAAALAYAKMIRLKPGRSITLEIATGSRKVREVRVERSQGGHAYIVHLKAGTE